jgi:Cu/Zn superoxide dismutase
VEGDFGNPTATPSPIAPGAQALGHYNHDVHFFKKAFPKPGELPSETIAEVSPKTEVWFDLVPEQRALPLTRPGSQVDSDGIMSVVVHVLPTNTELDNPNPGGVGSAGPRQACFPLSVTDIFPTPPAPTG